jgi:hypothetical protein
VRLVRIGPVGNLSSAAACKEKQQDGRTEQHPSCDSATLAMGSSRTNSNNASFNKRPVGRLFVVPEV